MRPQRVIVDRLCLTLGMLAMPVLTGCFMDTVPEEDYRTAQRELQLTREKLRSVETQLAGQEQTTRTLQEDLARLRGLDQQQALAHLIVPVRLQFASLSGGFDDDRRPGDDGLQLFVQPLDADNHVIKAAGSLKVTILDPLNPPNRNVVAEYHYDVPTTRKMWYGRMWTSHFSIRCPWPNGQIPVHDELTGHVAFTDLLTGATLTVQQAFKIKLPAT